MKLLRLALIGAGNRCTALYKADLKKRSDVEIVAVCDTCSEKSEKLASLIEADGRVRPSAYEDYRRCLGEEKPDAVLISTAWEAHLKIAMYAMESGIAAACEVGGAYSLESLWELVRCYERTGTPIMLLENCCYGRLELLALNMKRSGVLGRLVHCEGGYRHDLREEISGGAKNGHYRLWEYICRNCENYPTHEIGPIAKLLDINCGNRFLTLTSMGSLSAGMEKYARDKEIEALAGVRFNQSDVVTTLIKCQNGETITITLDTCNPRYYSRGFLAQGTKGLIAEENSSVYLEEDNPGECYDWSAHYNNVGRYYEKYEHPLWQDYHPGSEGHGGMDTLMLVGFFGALSEKKPMPIDVYDMATWMSISVLSEQSIATGQSVAFPDFTDGKWIVRKNTFATDSPQVKK